MRQMVSMIRADLAIGHSADHENLLEDSQAILALIDQRAAELEDFKSAVAILRNSLMYYDRLISEALRKGSAGGVNGQTLSQLASLSASLLRNTAIPNGSPVTKPREILERLKAGSKAEALRHLVDHAGIVVAYSEKVNQAVERITALPLDERILALRDNYRRYHNHRVERSELYRTGLSIIAAGLIALVAFTLWRLSHTARHLRQAVNSLEESEVRFRQLAETIREVFWLTDAKTHQVIYASPAFEQLWGKPLRQLYADAMEWVKSIHPDDRARVSESFEKQAFQGMWLEEYRVVRPDGSKRWIRDRGFPVHDASGNVIRVAGIAEDVTEQRVAQAELQRHREHLEDLVEERTSALQALNRELEAFSYSVSHDLRAPLRAIDGFSQALLEDYGERLDETALDYLKRVRAAAQRMGELIDDLLQLSRVTRAEMKSGPVDISALAQEVVATVRGHEPGRAVEVTVAPGLRAQGDAPLLRIALENLLGNAWKFTSRKDKAKIDVGYTSIDGSSAFFVRDNGAGFDMQYAGKLFGAFQRLHPREQFEGTGVGLATVQRIINRHGGQVWAQAAPDKGATFFFTLPGAIAPQSSSTNI